MNQLKTLMGEEQELIARISAEESSDRLSEINHEQAILIEQLGAIEREIAAKQE